jgi:hypothetical protein
MVNVYSEKIFAEHPTAHWSLDDNVDYVSLISETQKNMSSSTYWTKTGSATVGTFPSAGTVFSSQPFPNSKSNAILTPASSGNTSFISVFNVNPTTFSTTKTITYGFYVYVDNIGTSFTIDIGTSATNFITTKITSTNKWIYVSRTLDITSAGSVKMYINFNYTTTSAINIYINGISAGYDSENSNSISLGLDSSNIVSLSSLTNFSTTQYGIIAPAYSKSYGSGYYLANNTTKELYAKDSSFSMVYGSSHSIKISPNATTGYPSIIFPGFGMMNEDGKYKTYTFEFWLRIDHQLTSSLRIFGPIFPISDANTYPDGLYIDGSFIRLKIGNNTAAHFIDEWARPMHIQLQMLDGMAILVINGEQVIKILFSSSSTTMTTYNSGLNDWLGFFSSTDVAIFEIDGVAIYAYQSSLDIAKRRFIYGQAVSYPQNLINAYDGQAVVFDYAFSNHTNNYNYPQNGKWNHGISDGLRFDNDTLSFPNYTLPNIESTSTTLDLVADNASNGNFINLKPNSSYSAVESYLNFNNLNMLNDQTQASYAVFNIPNADVTSNEQVLIKLQDANSLDYFIISRSETTVNYKYKVGGTSATETTILSKTVSKNIDFAVGINILDLVSINNQLVSLFGSSSQIRVFVGGDNSFSKTFTGNIKSVSFSSKNSLSYIRDTYALSQYFVSGNTSDKGTLWWTSASSMPLTSRYATYTLLPQKNLGIFSLDIATDTYWQDSIPVSALASGNTFGFAQFNIGYPEPLPQSNGTYSTTNSLIRTYAMFQNATSSNTMGYSLTSQSIPATTSITPGSEYTTNKYEIIDGSAIYAPSTISDPTTLLLTIYKEIRSSGIFNNPISIRSMQLASQSSDKNIIKTKYGIDLSPYKDVGTINSPYRISKLSMPYLYMDGKSGIKLIGSETGRKISIPINKNGVSPYTINSIQFALKYDSPNFSSYSNGFVTKIMQINASSNTIINFYLKSVNFSNSSTSADKGYIYARKVVNGTEETTDFVDLQYYISGNLCANPVISIKQWNMIAISFNTPLDFSGSSNYSFDIVNTSSMNSFFSIDNITFYQSTSVQSQQFNSWTTTKNQLWSFYVSPYTWSKVFLQDTSINLGATPDLIYKIFIGTNIIVADSNVHPLKLQKYEYVSYLGIVPTSKIYLPT